MARLCGLFLLFSLALSGCLSTAGRAEVTTAKVTTPENSEGSVIVRANGVGLEVDAPAGSHIEFTKSKTKQPKPSDEPAIINTKGTDVIASSGKAADVKKGVAGFGFGTFLVGVGLFLFGGVLFLGPRFNLLSGFIPKRFVKWSKVGGILCMATGGIIVFGPALFDTLAPVIFAGSAAAAAVGLIWWVWNIYQSERRQERAFADADTAKIER